jgi:hypothetical protein
MAADLTTYDKGLKNVYAPKIVEQLNNRRVLLKRLNRLKEGFDGRQFIIPVHMQRNEQIASITSTGNTLPTAATQEQEGLQNAAVTPAYVIGVIKIQQQVIDQTKNNTGSFVRVIGNEVKSMAENIAMDANRQLYGDGTGSLTACGVTTASTTVVVTSTRRIFTGMGIDVIIASSGATGTGAVGRSVVSVASATTFVISGAAITTDSTYAVYRAGSRTNDWTGLQAIVAASGALFGLNPATAGQEPWFSNVFTSVGAVTEANQQKAFDAASENKFGNGADASLVVTTYGVRRNMLNYFAGLRRVVNSTTLEGGFDAITFNGKPITVDRDCTAGYEYFLDESHLGICQVVEPSWMDEDGHVLKWDTGTMSYKGVFRWFGNLYTDARDAQTVNQGVTES